MYKLIIVEDEYLIREGLVKSVDWNSLGFEIMAAASNGKEALDIIKRQKPDAVLTDIRMPIMDGLELSRIIHEQFDDIHVIIISGFADFEYARTAIKYKVNEYLLKPTNKQKFIEAFKRVREELNYINNRKKLSKKYQTRINEALFGLRGEFVRRLIEGDYFSTYTLKERIDYLEIDLLSNFYCVATLKIDYNEKELLRTWKEDRNLIKYAYNNIITEQIEQLGKGTAYIKDINEIIILFGCKKQGQTRNFLNTIIIKSIEIIKMLHDNYKMKIFAGIGKEYNNIIHTSKSYYESLEALEKRFFENDKQLFFYEEEDEVEIEFEKQWITNYFDESNKIVEAVINGDTDTVKILVYSFFKILEEESEPKLVKGYCNALYFILFSNLSEFKEGFKNIDDEKFQNKILSITTIDSLRDYMEDILVSISDKIKQVKENDFSYHKKIIDQAKEYIKNNYNNNLSLEDLGNKVYLSPTYFSFLFKNITGETYSDYLKRIRIEKAKELLNRIDLKIYEIANLVGYKDYKYFTNQFKKYEGMSPKEYRKRRA